MDNSFQTSFIPKKPIISSGYNAPKNKTLSISMVVSVFILIVVCGAMGGLFVYKDYLQKNKAELSANLLKIKDSFNKDTIALLEMYDKKSSVATQVLDGHMVLSPLFEAINEFTLSSIQYTKFEYSIINNIISVKMSGIAKDYKSIALQADVFSSNKDNTFKDLVFSNLTKDKTNFVTFDLEFNTDVKLLSYKDNIITNINSNPVSDSTSDTENVIDTLPETNQTQ
ncbi:MAG: hypothetical protein UR85_C0004G0023 [Candidatus Nomurabacteria bacterium GW2011_GWF2_35_66]|uniref:Fimbrial assembly family protein n=1 Tax=Candidatus Nomurabacteria bacterium GW2011_GWE1_35_16 TaxID=1618761 RepID=A0A0G0BBD8_9BACT|nr:MAG: hypothetical protein UR55_C0002G0022 [Candidatus Nomurabacteria bacterium GW2011_GWF1_34_20]KKP63601.1 MAG: hypothetical protein UR57_C0002G0022 [Candidatus Nomurabacteria bacterium GW2011_GWE2_34_25]KKP66803.1 MAG: hypothetical protein UR64_C0002G0019 [Candidatus Nomurabacteria bacterium GW2011_GWE1_35_16]KKP83429.1 MAG: hypothetical protein UR85_C0004G0023 [Candidatus Nomurabacteria bacterium GW2011_GWF2_35_66]HAE36639.1 hypothetical protein [Candidatus Nomurabacteria bacterium]